MKGKMNILCFLAALFAITSCGSGNTTETKEPIIDTVMMQQDTVEVVGADSATVYSDVVNLKNCFILISKPEYRLYVCEVVEGDTVKRAHFPVCVGKAKGPKQKKMWGKKNKKKRLGRLAQSIGVTLGKYNW